MVCSAVLREQGKAYPRTCSDHGLGPCPSPSAEAVGAGMSINEENSAWPVRQEPWHGRECGTVLYFPRTHILGVVTAERRGGAAVAPLLSPEGSAYPPGGYDIFVGDDELARAVIIGDDALRLVEQYALCRLAVPERSLVVIIIFPA